MIQLTLILTFALLAPTSGLGQDRPHILLTNDDGIEAEGIQAMYRELVEIGRVTVAAPTQNQSGIGHASTISGNNPIFVNSRTDENGSVWHAIAARPSDTVRLALHALLDEPPDIVVSGSNFGQNTGLRLCCERRGVGLFQRDLRSGDSAGDRFVRPRDRLPQAGSTHRGDARSLVCAELSERNDPRPPPGG